MNEWLHLVDDCSATQTWSFAHLRKLPSVAQSPWLNKQSIEDGSRILSSFKTVKEVKIWIITEAEDDSGQRAATTILLPEEY